MVRTVFAFFERLVGPYDDANPSPPPAALAAFTWHYARQFRWPLVGTLLTVSVIAIVEVMLFAFLGALVDLLTASDPATFWSEHRAQLLVMGGVLALYPLLAILISLLSHQTLLGNFAMAIRWRAHRTLLRQSMSFFQDEFAGRLGAKVMQTALSVRDTVMVLLDQMAYVVVYFVSSIVLFAQSDLRLTAPLLLWFVGYVGVASLVMPRLRLASKAQADARAGMTGRIVDSYTNIATVKMFAHAEREEAYVRDGMDAFLATVFRQMRFVTWLTIGLYVLNAALIFSVAALGIWLWQRGAVTTGSIALAIALVLRLESMSQWILWRVAELFENIGTTQDGMNTLAREQSVVDKSHARPLQMQEGAIRFEHVRFHYGKEGGVIDDLSLTIRPGEKVGLVGRSGAGKSTLVNLLLRLYDVEAGRIAIDGQDVSAVTQESLRGAISVVTQDTSLLHRSIADNIAYGRPDASLAEIERAARQAHAHAFIADLRDAKGRKGLDAHVGERGVKLSGGQRQRIAIARVLLKDAPILVLDEATSALDSEVEAAIQDSLYELMEGKTVIAIAHRLSTIAALDRLIVMDQGAIVEEGTHAELIERDGLYARLWARQSGGFLASREGGARAA